MNSIVARAVLVISSLFSLSCAPDVGASPSTSENSSAIDVNPPPSVPLNTLFSTMDNIDPGGYYEIKSFRYFTGKNSHNHVSVSIPSDFVVIGGGAAVYETTNSPSAFLTESRPDLANNAWSASSKDHLTSDPHYLQVDIIGLKILNQPSSNVQVFTATSTVQAHPRITASVPSDYVMVGGGAFINYGTGQGNLLVSSYPSSPNTWYAEGKDSVLSSPATITAYAIGYRVGYLSATILASSPTQVSCGEDFANLLYGVDTPLPSDFVYLSCPGAQITYNVGRTLKGYWPYGEHEATNAWSRDIKNCDSGFTTSYGIFIHVAVP